MKSHEHAMHHRARQVTLTDDLRQLIFIHLASHLDRKRLVQKQKARQAGVIASNPFVEFDDLVVIRERDTPVTFSLLGQLVG